MLQILYEGMQVELRFAAFFLCKLLRSRNADVDINHLQSLDPDFYKWVLWRSIYWRTALILMTSAWPREMTCRYAGQCSRCCVPWYGASQRYQPISGRVDRVFRSESIDFSWFPFWSNQKLLKLVFTFLSFPDRHSEMKWVMWSLHRFW